MDGLNFLFGMNAIKPIHEDMKSNEKNDDAIICENPIKAVNLIESNDLTALFGYSQAEAAVRPKEICMH